MEHPNTCFGICRHNTIIPLKITNVEDYGDGCYGYTLEINHPKPTRHMLVHHEADFSHKIVTKDSSLCDEFTKIRATLDEAKQFVTKSLRADRTAAMCKVNRIDKQLAEVDASVAELEAVINPKSH
ncbi:hypothetical protein [Enterovibrio norvegicus]|uniref:hypothetical protein n=1 Tax=Enterovibrio norvegicus TaxID=188144 RepID=UPI000C82C624|nr:hypothetical protein [Enterovibrio norvegicus]PMH64476.1 hypothetical protein BCU62_15590 [Enterovibrio norvegicus]